VGGNFERLHFRFRGIEQRTKVRYVGRNYWFMVRTRREDAKRDPEMILLGRVHMRDAAGAGYRKALLPAHISTTIKPLNLSCHVWVDSVTCKPTQKISEGKASPIQDVAAAH
jgi:hypothetical protein